MDTQIIPVTHSQTDLSTLAEQARAYARASKAPNTKRAYTFDWQHFTAWCERHDHPALPASPETVALYLTDLATREQRKVSTIQRHLATISQAHQTAGLDNPAKKALVREVLRGIRRAKGVAPNYKQPLLIDHIRQIAKQLSDSLLGVRDRALLLLGFAGAFRRSELVGLNVDDLAFIGKGLEVTLRHSKTDQEQAGAKLPIPYGSYPDTCPVRAVRAWLDQANLTEGAVFRPITRHGQIQPQRLSGDAVARIIKRMIASIGLDPAQYAGHSLRAGHATQAATNGVSERIIMNQTRHKSVLMLRRYIHDADQWHHNSAAELGL
jgi:integrase